MQPGLRTQETEGTGGINRLNTQGSGAQVELIRVGQATKWLESHKGRKWGSETRGKSYFQTKPGNDKTPRT